MDIVLTLLFSTVFVFVVERVLIHLWDKLKTDKADRKNRRYK